MKLKQRPWNLLLHTVFILTIFSLFRQDQTIDIHLHDTYFVITEALIYQALAVPILLLWLLYLLTAKILYSKKLSWLHTIITILTAILIVATLNIDGLGGSAIYKRYYEYVNWESYAMFGHTMQYVGIALMILLGGQIFFLVNIVAGIIKWSRQRKG